ncbi:hypothetical protein MBRA1_003210 [Malassezia brasiliensis]|uniref:Glycoside hydrolase family 5 C-terminal domain-containing protein n=1 Tax=Malassezia brasiliensis TaxID=1821822 RepID=A0AAF0DYZ9_9BASI|nr:hypothetical protein MBRA1_003210 [Malassezia brasiliensis]
MALLLVEPIPNEFMPRWGPGAQPQGPASAPMIPKAQPANLVYGPHFYDLNVLFFKAYRGMSVNVQGLSRGMFILCALYFGARGLARNYYYQLRQLTQRGYAALGEVPIVVGEVGIPFDVNDTLRRTPGDYSVQRTLLSALVSALERNLISFTLWNYNPANTVEHGDGWNQEDFSLVNFEARAADRQNVRAHETLYRGGRALDAVLRPYACKVAGIPVSTAWDAQRRTLRFSWRNGPEACRAPTEVYVPEYLFCDHAPQVQLSDGTYKYVPEEQTLYIYHAVHTPGAVHHVTLQGAGARDSMQGIMLLAALCALLVALLAYRARSS